MTTPQLNVVKSLMQYTQKRIGQKTQRTSTLRLRLALVVV
jgi:hypothetical protein